MILDEIFIFFDIISVILSQIIIIVIITVFRSFIVLWNISIIISNFFMYHSIYNSNSLAYNIGCMSTSGQLLTSAVPDSVSLALGSNSVSAVLPPFSGANSSSLSSPILVSGKVHLEVQGPRLNSTKDERLGKMYGPDKRLNLIIMDKMPKLEVTPTLLLFLLCFV